MSIVPSGLVVVLFPLLVTLISGSSSNNSNTTIMVIKPTPVVLPIILQQSFEQSEKCNDFLESVNNEFHSPNYPNDYHDSLNCVKVISAGPGEVIRLRFLDHFHLEPDAACRYDYLEVRDGQYGYSNLITKICGTSPPTVLESSGRHLWLRFHSDQDIHHIGFRAFVEFVPSTMARPDLDDCSFHLTSLEANITSEELSPEILINRKELSMLHLDCTWRIEAPPGQKIYMQFRDFNLEKANDCTFNFVEIYGSRTELYGKDGLMQQYCGSDTKPTFSKTNVIHLRFYTTLTPESSDIGIGFKTKLNIYYSLYRDLSDKGAATEEPDRCKDDEEFDCTDNTCIHLDLICNYQSNCKQGNDEDKVKCKGQKATFQMTMDLIVIAFIGCFLAAGMCSGLILNICRKLRQDKIELEEIRQASLHKSKDSVVVVASQKPSSSSKHNSSKKQDVEDPPVKKDKSSSSSSSSSSSTEERKKKTKKLSLLNVQQETTTPPSQNSSSESTQTVIFKSQQQQQSSPPPPIPYSPPPPYNPNASMSKLLKREEPDQQQQQPPPPVQVIEVRDCACQTRESFTEKYLRDVYFGTTRHYTAPSSQFTAPKRAPLARSEAVMMEEDNNHNNKPSSSRQFRRAPKGNADVLMTYPTRGPASVCSSVDASTGSLELLHELDEGEEQHI